MTQKVAAGGVELDRHVLLNNIERPRARDLRQIIPEFFRVHGIAERLETRKFLERIGVETVQIGKVAGLLNSVDVGLLWGEGNVLDDLSPHIAQERV